MKRISFIIIMLCLILASCESRSGRRGEELRILAKKSTNEKVVILTVNRETFYTVGINLYNYKIKRISDHTVTFIQIRSNEPFAVTDTIMWKFE